ncbi:MAG: hypothetical protein LBD37_05020 [Treponema sp.]|jgi:phosphoglycerate dehydrogenase-like enzyme|nr:hypothetical protein [Treponema sp.]
MKIAIIGNRDRYEKFSSQALSNPDYDLVFLPRDTGYAEALTHASDAEVIVADAIAVVSRNLIQGMPRLRMIHSEGVAYDKIDRAAAAERGIYVCNNKGCNAAAVSEQAVLLMLAWLRRLVAGDREVRAGRQIEMKERLMVEGIVELGDCAVGLVGFGDIAKATALRLRAFGCPIYYYVPRRKPHEEEERYHVHYAELADLAAISDIVSIHTAVTPETTGMINASFIQKMKPSSCIVNTARGEIVDNTALRSALINGAIAGAAFDTLFPEPTPKDHPLVDLPEHCKDRVVYAPHLGGISAGSFKRAHHTIWENIARIAAGKTPVNIVSPP